MILGEGTCLSGSATDEVEDVRSVCREERRFGETFGGVRALIDIWVTIGFSRDAAAHEKSRATRQRALGGLPSELPVYDNMNAFTR